VVGCMGGEVFGWVLKYRSPMLETTQSNSW
jgi:hypothetical protein